MVENLVKKLRTCSKEERRNIAIQISRTSTDEAIGELIRMVEGRHRRGLKWYTLDDQLIGIEALGETGRQDVLDLLIEMYTPLTEHGENHELNHPLSGKTVSVVETSFNYPNVTDELNSSLSFTYFSVHSNQGFCRPSSWKERYNERFHEVFKSAIMKLGGRLPIEIMDEVVYSGKGLSTEREYKIVTRSGPSLKVENVPGGIDQLFPDFETMKSAIKECCDNPTEIDEFGSAANMLDTNEIYFNPVNPFATSDVHKVYVLIWDDGGCEYSYIYHFTEPKNVDKSKKGVPKRIPYGEYLRVEYPNEELVEIAIGYHEIGDEKKEFCRVALNRSDVEEETAERLLEMFHTTTSRLRKDIPQYFSFDKS